MSTLLTSMAQIVLPVLLDASLKGTVILAVAGLVTVLLRRRPAAIRHLVWSLALGACIALPVLSACLPPWRVPVDTTWLEASPPRIIEKSLPPAGALAELPARMYSRTPLPNSPRMQNGPVTDTNTPPIVTDSTPVRATTSPAISLPVKILVVWLIGAVVALMPLALGIVSLRRLRRRSCRMNDGFLTALVGLLAERLGIHRSIDLLASRRRTMPMTWGVRRPVILLPDESLDWTPQCLRVVILHELAHIRRADCLLQVVGQICRAMYWFNPLAWLAMRQLRAEQERACDDIVINSGPSAPDYAEHLLAVTAGLPASRIAAPVALAMGRPRRIEHRLRVILDPTRDRRPLTRRQMVAGCIILAGLLGPLAVLSPTPVDARTAPGPNTSNECVAPSPAEDERIAEVRSLIIRNYVRPVKESDLSDGAIRGMVSALSDPYSEYLTQEQYEELGRSTQGTFAGVGIQLNLSDNQLTVVTPIEASPAHNAGIQPGDKVLAIDDHSTKEMTLPDAVKQILGPKGSQVKLRIQHPDGQEADVVLTRAQIKVPSVKGFRRDTQGQWQYIIDPATQIGYVAITQFTSTTADDLRRVLQSLKNDGLKGLIVDLRFCPGGLLSTAVQIAEQFIDKGDIVTVRGHHEAGSTYKAGGKALLDNVPTVVLINEQTASAAEVLAGAVRDNDRAIVLGTRSYGKGSVQNIHEVSGKGMIRLTTAFFYLPGGRGIHRSPGIKEWGVDPTEGYYLPLDSTQTEALLRVARQLDAVGHKKGDASELPPLTSKTLAEKYADPQAAAALETLKAKITKGEFAPVGKSNAVMLEHLAKRDDLLKKRETLQKELEQVGKALRDLEKPIPPRDK